MGSYPIAELWIRCSVDALSIIVEDQMIVLSTIVQSSPSHISIMQLL